MTDLAADLEAAEQGSRELSDRVLQALGWTYRFSASPSVYSGRMVGNRWYDPDGTLWKPEPHPTESVDDGLALVEAMGMKVSHVETIDGRWCFEVANFSQKKWGSAWHTSWPLALSAALVRAAEASNG